MKTLVWVEHDGSAVKDATLSAVTAAAKLGEVHLLVAGEGVDGVAQAAAQIAGVGKVHVADDAAYAHALAENVAPLVVELMGHHDAFVVPATTTGKNVLPRVAALLDVMQVSEVTRVIAPDIFERPIYAGNVIQTVVSADPIKVISVRTAAFAAAGRDQPVAPIEAVGVAVPDQGLSRFESEAVRRSDRPELTSARTVVSGGRALGSAEDFERLIIPLADALGGAIGASRAAVDLGYAPNDWQVGQTGKVVVPDLYLAVGISGAIQHLAGMKDAKVVVAANKDAEAPIFQVADVGLVADLFSAVPKLTAAIAAAKSGRP